MEHLPQIHLPRDLLHWPFRKLGMHDIESVYDVMAASVGPGVVPPGMVVNREDAARLFVVPQRPELRPVVGPHGCQNEAGRLDGFIALAELELDGSPHLEFYIFFRPDAPRVDLVGAAMQLNRYAHQQVSDPICTLIYQDNARAKAFYSKAGFSHDRNVMLDGMALEMWLWSWSPAPATD
jgi:hypothetical protein